MELIMTSHTSTAVIEDEGRFGGVVTLEQLRATLDLEEPDEANEADGR
jgi:hypothetical protein